MDQVEHWDWKRSHHVRDSVLAASAVLLVGSLIVAFVVVRSRDRQRPDLSNLGPVAPSELVDDKTTGPESSTTTLWEPASILPVVPDTTLAAVTNRGPTTPARATTVPASQPTTTQATATPITASPPYSGGPKPTYWPSTRLAQPRS